jgi:hypothetical protein
MALENTGGERQHYETSSAHSTTRSHNISTVNSIRHYIVHETIVYQSLVLFGVSSRYTGITPPDDSVQNLKHTRAHHNLSYHSFKHVPLKTVASVVTCSHSLHIPGAGGFEPLSCAFCQAYPCDMSYSIRHHPLHNSPWDTDECRSHLASHPTRVAQHRDKPLPRTESTWAFQNHPPSQLTTCIENVPCCQVFGMG